MALIGQMAEAIFAWQSDYNTLLKHVIAENFPTRAVHKITQIHRKIHITFSFLVLLITYNPSVLYLPNFCML